MEQGYSSDIRWFRCWLTVLNSIQAIVKSDRRHRFGHSPTPIIGDRSDLRPERYKTPAKQT